jgi:hypothetical protein
MWQKVVVQPVEWRWYQCQEMSSLPFGRTLCDREVKQKEEGEVRTKMALAPSWAQPVVPKEAGEALRTVGVMTRRWPSQIF